MIDVCLLGCGGMMPLPYRHLTSLMVRLNGSSLLIDCGEGTQIALKKKGWSFKPIDVICFTHFHGDHIGGLPGLLLTMGNAERTEPLTLIGPKGLAKVVNSLRVIAPELPFEIRYLEIEGEGQEFRMNGYRLKAFRVQHRITCYGYSLMLDRIGRFDPQRAQEQQIPLKYWNPLQKGRTMEDPETGRVFTPDMVLGADRKGLKVTYVTDTRPTRSIVENAASSDLFICEGMYGEEDKFPNAKKNKHMMIREAAGLARDAGAEELWLTHYSPALVHPENYLDDALKIFPNTKCGRDGMSAELNFEGEEGTKEAQSC
jgi:ribonuclease Z